MTFILAAAFMPPVMVASVGVLVILLGSVLFAAGAGWILASLQSLKGAKAVTLILSAMFVGFVAGGFIGVLSFAEVKKREVEVRHGWNLKPVVVAAVDLAAGQKLTFDVISERSMPEQFVTAAAVTPDHAEQLVDKPTRIALRAGDIIYWGFTCP